MNTGQDLTKLTFKKQRNAEGSLPSVAGRVKFFTWNIIFMSFTKIRKCMVK